MKKLFVGLLLASSLSWTVQTQAADKVLRIGTEGAYAPFNFTAPNGELQGFEIDIAKALCEEMKVKCQLVQQDWDGMIPALLAKKYDAIMASMAITNERKQKIDFSNKYYSAPSRFVHKAGDGVADITPAALKGKRIGVQRATIQDGYLSELYKDSTVIRYGTQEEANLDLAAGRVDLLFADAIVLSEAFLKTDQGKGYEFIGPNISDAEKLVADVGVGLRKGDAELRESINKAILAIRANGKYDAIAKKYFEFDIYGN